MENHPGAEICNAPFFPQINCFFCTHTFEQQNLLVALTGKFFCSARHVTNFFSNIPFCCNNLEIFIFTIFWYVSFTMKFCNKFWITIWTTERFFSSMRTNMTFHIRWSLHYSRTIWTSICLRTKMNWFIL